MKLTILGSGTAVPLLYRNNAGYLLEDDGKNFLLDSGAGSIRRMLELNVDLFSIDHIFYTHLHNDHINDLGAIIWSNNYGMGRKTALNIYGPKGFNKYFKILIEKILKPTKLNYGINVKEMWNGSIIKIPIKNENNKKFLIINKIDKNSMMDKNNKNNAKNIKN